MADSKCTETSETTMAGSVNSTMGRCGWGRRGCVSASGIDQAASPGLTGARGLPAEVFAGEGDAMYGSAATLIGITFDQ